MARPNTSLAKAAALTRFFEDRLGSRVDEFSHSIATDRELAELIYLVDWKHAVEKGEQLTGFTWKLDADGVTPTEGLQNHDSVCNPVVEDCTDIDVESRLFSALRRINVDMHSVLDDDDIQIAESIVSFLEEFPSLSQFVDSTYPVATRPVEAILDLGQLAYTFNKFREIMSQRRKDDMPDDRGHAVSTSAV